MYNIEMLDNGLKIVSYSMSGMKSVSIGIWVRVGGRYENKSNNGISHVLEHLLFKGTKHRSAKKIKSDIEGLGGSLNGFTAEEVSCYLAKVVGKHLPLALEVLSDMVLHPLLASEDLEKEKVVICEEIRMYHDLPMHYVHELLHQLLWPNQPLGRHLTGTIETVSCFRRQDLLEFKNVHYTPSNMVAAVCGDIGHKQLVNELKRHFSNTQPASPCYFLKAKLRQKKPQTTFYFKQTEQTHLCLGTHAFHRRHPDRHALSLLHIILGGNMSSRLFQEIRERRGLVYDIHSSVNRYHDTGAFVVSAGVENKNLRKTISAVLNVLKKVRREHVSRQEFRRAKEFYTGQLLMALEETSDHMGWLGEQMILLGRIKTQEEVLGEVGRVTIDDLRRVARTIFVDNSLNLAVIGPADDKAAASIKENFSFL